MIHSRDELLGRFSVVENLQLFCVKSIIISVAGYIIVALAEESALFLVSNRLKNEINMIKEHKSNYLILRH